MLHAQCSNSVSLDVHASQPGTLLQLWGLSGCGARIHSTFLSSFQDMECTWSPQKFQSAWSSSLPSFRSPLKCHLPRVFPWTPYLRCNYLWNKSKTLSARSLWNRQHQQSTWHRQPFKHLFIRAIPVWQERESKSFVQGRTASQRTNASTVLGAHQGCPGLCTMPEESRVCF